MNKETVPTGFSLSLVCVDAIPVLAFSGSMIVVATRFSSPLFLLGSILVCLAGCLKVGWKAIVVMYKRNIWPLFIQMRIVMPIGFGFILLSILFNYQRIHILSYLLSFPSCLFFLIGGMGMICMIFFSKKLDARDVKSNWIEQITNAIAQICILIGVLLI